MRSTCICVFLGLVAACLISTFGIRPAQSQTLQSQTHEAQTSQSQTYKEKVIHSFAGSPDDGSNPVAGLLEDSQGNFYGTTEWGGVGCDYYAGGCGSAFKLSATGIKTVIHSFCSRPDCADGSLSESPLIEDAQGNLYGTTAFGGDCSPARTLEVHMPGCGAVFKLTRTGKEMVLHSFTGGTDGYVPQAGLIQDSEGNLYGTTKWGGGTGCDMDGCGTVFKVDTKGVETVLYRFCGQTDCADGAFPYAALILDSEGSLYGTTETGGGTGCGGAGCGTAFRIDKSGETVLYSFCSRQGCSDGANPYGGLIRDSEGNLYGTTEAGGGTGCGGVGCGTVFSIDAKGKETVLYSFCSQSNCTDGASPYAGLIRDSSGNLYGTTAAGGSGTACSEYGGVSDCVGGTVFEIDSGGKESVLYSFCSVAGCTDGQGPVAGLIRAAGNLYGTTQIGGAADQGVVFELTP